jgi:hypothetical protein
MQAGEEKDFRKIANNLSAMEVHLILLANAASSATLWAAMARRDAQQELSHPSAMAAVSDALDGIEIQASVLRALFTPLEPK